MFGATIGTRRARARAASREPEVPELGGQTSQSSDPSFEGFPFYLQLTTDTLRGFHSARYVRTIPYHYDRVAVQVRQPSLGPTNCKRALARIEGSELLPPSQGSGTRFPNQTCPRSPKTMYFLWKRVGSQPPRVRSSPPGATELQPLAKTGADFGSTEAPRLLGWRPLIPSRLEAFAIS